MLPAKFRLTALPAPSATVPPGALMLPWLDTLWPKSATYPPCAALMLPRFTTPAVLEPVKLLRALPMEASSGLRVEASRPPTLIWASLPKITPLGLISQTWPLALILPRIWLPWVSKMRLTANALADGWTKLTVSLLATLKLCQLMESLSLAWLIVVVLPFALMLPLPPTSCPPWGAAPAPSLRLSKPATSAALSSGVALLLPRPRASSEATTQV